MADALLSSVMTKLEHLVSEEVGVVRTAKAELDSLKIELQAIRATVRAADGLPYFMVEGVKDWLQKLKEVAYDAEDVIDEYQARTALSEYQRAVRKKRVSGLLTSLPLFLNKHVKLRYKLGKEIKAINERLARVAKERERYNFDGFARKIKEVNTNRKTSYLFIEKDIVGRESDKEALIERLMLDEETSNSVPILSIVGVGGVGKTTLAKMVFNDERIKNQFGKSMWWVFVSQEPRAEDMSKKILEAVMKGAINISELNTMCELLRPVLSENKFFLVLDDVWDLDWWEQLKPLLSNGACGSKILITTRNAGISRDMRAVYMHELENFTFKESWDLFLQKALRDGETEEVLERLNLKDIAHDIVNKCGGLPLVVQTVGSIMHSKERNREDWKFIGDSKIWDWKLQSSSSQISSLLPGIILSYDDLPSTLRSYFAYLSLLEKGDHLNLGFLVASAMAHGFVEDADGIDMEVIAAQQINDLLGRCLLQLKEPEQLKLIMHDVQLKQHLNLIMHDIFHDLTTYVAGREYCRGSNSINQHTRHLAIRDCLTSLDEIVPQLSKSLRTLVCYGGLSESPLERNFNNLKSLRVLILNGSTFSKLPDSVGDLILLKYLGLTNSCIEELPATIGRLYNLQTLRLGGSKIKRLPKEIGDLCNLRNLGLDDTYNLEFVPEGLGKLSCLRELTRFLICDGDGTDVAGSNIRELKELNKLHGKLAIHSLEKVREKNDAKNAELQEKRYLEELELAFGKAIVHKLSTLDRTKDVAEAHESLFQELLLPPNLKHLTVTLYCGRLFPANWCSHDNQMHLQSLKLQSCPCIETLPIYSSLTSLHLFECHHLRELPSFPCLLELVIGQCDGLNELPIFSKLETLILNRLVNLEELSGVEGHAIASLTTSLLSNCPKLRSLPYLPALKQLHVNECKSLCAIQEAQGHTKPNMPALTDLVICGCLELCELPSMPILKTLKMEDCHKIKRIPLSTKLEKLEVLNCPNWEGWTLVTEKDPMSCLHELKIHVCPILRRLPPAPSLAVMIVSQCKELNALWDEKEPPVGLEILSVCNCPELGFSLESVLPLSKLQRLGFSWSPQCAQAKPSHLAYLQRLSVLFLEGLPGQNPLPEWLWHFSSLKWLTLISITEARSLHGKWQQLKQLESLHIQICPELVALEELFFTEPQKQDNGTQPQKRAPLSIPPKLEKLVITACLKLESLPSGLEHMIHLKYLTLKMLPELTSLPQEITNLHKLEILEIEDCPRLGSLPVELKHRLGSKLIIRGCPALEEG